MTRPTEDFRKDKTILTPDAINELMKDWFVRDGKTFTRITAATKLAWEPSSGTYSDYLTEGVKYTHAEIFKRAYELGRSLLVSMDLPGKVRLRLDKEKSATDGVTVWLSTQVFDEKDYTVGECIDVFLGLAAHEGAHLLYTDMPLYQAIEKRIIQMFANIYEDERIEQLIGEHKPGLTRYLEKVKYYYFDKMFMDGATEPLPDTVTVDNAFNVAFETILRIIRFPRYIRKEDVEFFGMYLARIQDVLTPYPTSTKEVIESAEATYHILKEFIKEKMEDEREKTGKGKKMSDDDIAKEMDKVADKMADKFEKVFGKTEELGTDEGLVKSKKLGKHEADILDGSLEMGEGRTFITKPESDTASYRETYAEVLPYIAAVRKVLKYNDKDYKLVHKCMRNGYLDTNKLVEAKMGVPTVYESYGRVVSDKVAVCFLIDQSGSMGGSSIRAAKQCAILLYEALKVNRSIELFVYGHSADITEYHGTDLYTYVEPGYAPKGGLGSVKARSQNRDGDAIYETAVRVRKKTQRKCLMFVLSDGEPCAGDYHGSSAINDTRTKVKRVTRMGFDVCQVAINHSYDPKTMFDHAVVFEDLSTLARDLNKFVKKAILKNQKVRIF